MSNVTLSIPDELLQRSRAFAKAKGTTLNQMIRDLLGRHVPPQKLGVGERFLRHTKRVSLDTITWKWDRDELYER